MFSYTGVLFARGADLVAHLGAFERVVSKPSAGRWMCSVPAGCTPPRALGNTGSVCKISSGLRLNLIAPASEAVENEATRVPVTCLPFQPPLVLEKIGLVPTGILL